MGVIPQTSDSRDNTPSRGVIPQTSDSRDNTPRRGVIPQTSGTKVEGYYYTLHLIHPTDYGPIPLSPCLAKEGLGIIELKVR